MPSAPARRRARIAAPPSCYYGGIGTERLEREIQLAFPDVAARRMDSDTMRGSGSHERVLKAFQSGEVRILLGTQMIAKGLDFPNVTLVGVVSADTALHLPDFRAAEKTFQLVAQVAGRTGRGDKPGRVHRADLFTRPPRHPPGRASRLRGICGKSSCRCARSMVFRPYGRLVRVIARGSNEASVQSYMDDLAMAFRRRGGSVGADPGPGAGAGHEDPQSLSVPSSASLPELEAAQAVGWRHTARYPPPEGVEVAVDVDPISML